MTPEHETPDADLIRAYLDGDAASFDVLYERYKRPLYGYLQKTFRDGHSAAVDDLFQKTWLKAIANLTKYQDQEKFIAWLVRIAGNLAIDFFRTAKRHAEDSFDDGMEAVLPAQESTSPDSGIKNRELADAIDAAVSELSPDIRTVFLLRQEDVPFREIAEIQKCSINTCLARMQYALKYLRKKLEPWK